MFFLLSRHRLKEEMKPEDPWTFRIIYMALDFTVTSVVAKLPQDCRSF
jgi:hypothetical protein